MSELGPLSNNIHEVAPLVKSRELSPVELTRAAIDHAERMQPVLKSFITLTPELALRQAQKLEGMLMRGEWLGPLHGVPVGLKDMLETKGVLTTDGSKALEDYVPDEDAPVVSRLRAAGAVILGKENMHEIGAGFLSDNAWFGRVRNPWDTERYAGGSSGGSAANVAAYVTFASLGTDGGGSVRQPSAVCGIVGMKATYGRVSNLGCLEGVDPANFHVGPHTRCVRDNAIVLRAIAGDEPLDPSTVPVPLDDYEGALDRDIRGLVMGIPENHFYDPLDVEVAEAVSRAIAVLEEFGVEARPVEMKHLDLLPLVQMASRANSVVAYEDQLREARANFSPEERHRMLSGQFVLAKDHVRAQQARRIVQREWLKVMNEVDFLVTPTTPAPAWRFDDTSIALGDSQVDVDSLEGSSAVMGRNTSPGNLAGVPGLSVPCGFSSAGMPIGLQLYGRPWEESLLYRVAQRYERSAGQGRSVPPAVEAALA